MFTNRGALGALAVVGVMAAAGGAYFAGRQHPVPEPQAISAHDVTLQPAPGAVTETENSLTPVPAPEIQPQAAPVVAAPVRPANPASGRQPANRPAPSRPQSQSARPS